LLQLLKNQKFENNNQFSWEIANQNEHANKRRESKQQQPNNSKES